MWSRSCDHIGGVSSIREIWCLYHSVPVQASYPYPPSKSSLNWLTGLFVYGWWVFCYLWLVYTGFFFCIHSLFFQWFNETFIKVVDLNSVLLSMIKLCLSLSNFIVCFLWLIYTLCFGLFREGISFYTHSKPESFSLDQDCWNPGVMESAHVVDAQVDELLARTVHRRTKHK